MTSFKDAQQVVCNGPSKVWGQVVDPLVKKNKDGLGFSAKNGKNESLKTKTNMNSYHDVFRSGGYLNPIGFGINAVEEDEAEQEVLNYVTHGLLLI